MQVTANLTLSGQALNRIAFPNGLIAVDIIQNFSIENEKPAADPSFSFFGLLIKLGDKIVLHGHSAKAGRRTNRRNRRQFAMRFMKLEHGMEVDIGYAVAVREHESFILIQPRSQSLQPAAGLGVQSRIDQMNLPVRLIAVMDSRFAGAQIDRDIVIEGVEVEEIFFDDFRFVSQSDNKLVDSVAA